MLAYVEILTGCPCRCPHCHVPIDLRMNPIVKNEEQLRYEFFKLKTVGVDKITISGGEPTLHKSISPIIMDAKKQFDQVALITNGFNKDVLEMLVHQCDVWFSIDFWSVRHDEWRRLKGLWKNYLELKSEVNVRSTLMSYNLEDLKKLIPYVVKNEREITIVPYKGKGKLEPSARQMRELFSFIIRNKYMKYVYIDDPCIKMFLALHFPDLKKTVLNWKQTRGRICPALWEVIGVDINGNVSICPFDMTPMINIKDLSIEKLEELRKSFNPPLPDACIDCPYNSFCGGCHLTSEKYCLVRY